jgi:tetratricopeptide (TPR) repeat protein
VDYLEGFLKVGWGLLWISRGRIGKGMNLLYEAREFNLRNELKCSYGLSEYTLGRIYQGMALGEGNVNLATMLKNIGFLLKTIPFATRRAETHLRKAIEVSREIRAKGILASALLDLGNLHKAKGRIGQAREHIAEAVQLFEECKAGNYLSQAKSALKTLA